MDSKYLGNLLLFVTLSFIAYPVLCLTVDSINLSYNDKKKSNFNSRHHKNDVYQNQYHPGHGIELISGQNHGHRYNKNGVLFNVQRLLLIDEFNQLEIKDKKVFHKLVRNLESFKNGKNWKPKIFKNYYRDPNHSNKTLASIKEKNR